jgi:hypothetical protein
MNSRNEHFQPESVQEQINQFTQIAPGSAGHATPDARMVKDLRQVYTDYTRSGERVWERLAVHATQQDELPNDVRLLTHERFPPARSLPRQTDQLNTLQSQQVKPPRKPRHIFTLVAALLVAALLVGSTFWIFAVVSQLGGKATVSSKHPAAQTNRKTATPSRAMISPRDCPVSSFNSSSAWYQLCQTGQFVLINQSRTLAKGYSETIKGAYADRNQLVIWYDFSPIDAKDSPMPFNTLTTQQGTALFEWGGSTGIREKNQHFAWIEGYDTSNLPASLQTLTVKVDSSVSLIPDGISGTFPPDKTSFAFFAVPLHSAQTVTLRQTITANGLALTLDHVVIGMTGIHLVLSVPPLPFRAYSSGFDCALQAGSKHFSQADTYRSIDQHKAAAPPTGFEFTFDSNVTAQHGAWTLTVTSSGERLPWVFHFTVPS